MMQVNSRFALIVAIVGITCFAQISVADGQYKVTEATEKAEATVLFSGLDVSNRSYYVYQGMVTALNRDLGRDGIMLRLVGGHGKFDYDSSTVAGTVTTGNSWQGDLMLGYKVGLSKMYVALYGGLDAQNFRLTPKDFAADVRGTRIGAKVALDAETLAESRVYFAFNGAHSTAFDTTWLRVRAGANSGRVAFGPEYTYLRNLGYSSQRVGAFTKIDVKSSGLPLGITLSAGYQFVGDGRNTTSATENTGGGRGSYGGIGFDIVF